MNVVFFLLIAISFLLTGWQQLHWPGVPVEAISPMQALANGMIDSAKSAVTLALGLVGVMALFLGLMKVAERGGLLRIIARLMRPLMVRLFPEVPADHPAMGAMIMNLSANAMGLGNAATPFGIRAMQELDRLNPCRGTASNAMVLFLAINTSSVTLLPTGVIALRAAAGSTDPAGILPSTLFATLCSTTIAILATRLYQRWSATPTPSAAAVAESAARPAQAESASLDAPPAYADWICYTALGCLLGSIPLAVIYGREIGPWIIPAMAVGLLGFGMLRHVRVYEAFVEGARDGFETAVRIIPYLVAILVAVGMFRHSGALDLVIGAIGGYSAALGLPAEALPMALLRPLSGSGAYGVLAATIENPAIGPDSYTGYLVSTLQGSTETTFYVLAVYFGAVQVRRVRHALAAGLTADLAGVAGAVIACTYLFAA